MKTAFVIFDGMTVMDFIGIYDPLTRLKTMKIMPDFEWNVCAVNGEVADDKGLRVTADAVGKPLAGYDLLVVPGGMGTRTLQHDRNFIDWLKGAERVQYKASVCTGALLLGAAGYLEGRRATTHPGALEELKPYCARVVTDRVVDEGNVLTAGGVTAGIDLGLHLVERFAGAEARTRVAKQMDYPYRPAPPVR
ncbi:MAG: ThiJ/PfpI domain protein [Burkholderiales bacterium]|jgi:cyclohexyl-isocyanide hydratase|nr:ThiJ/PfpI domain protein [Burkholderiales bacterium]